LDGAEHRSSIEGVMVGASDEVQLVALMRAPKACNDRDYRGRWISRIIAR